MADKDYQNMLNIILPLAKQVFTVTPDNPRSMPAEKLADYVSALGVRAKACSSIEDGISDAVNSKTGEGVVCATGTFYMAGTIRSMFVSA